MELSRPADRTFAWPRARSSMRSRCWSHMVSKVRTQSRIAWSLSTFNASEVADARAM